MKLFNRNQNSFNQLVTSMLCFSNSVESELDYVYHGLAGKAQVSILEAAAAGDLSEVRFLVDKKIDVNTTDYDKRTALHLACCENHEEVVRYLISKDARVNAQDRWGHPPLDGAAPRIAEILMSSGANGSELNLYCPGKVTVLFVDIKNFTASCAALSAGEVGAWISTFYELVDRVAGPLGVRKAEMRGDCCICVAGSMEAAPCGRLRSAASPDDQMTRMLQFIAELHRLLLSSGISVRIGVAYGEAAFLVDDSFISVQGDVVNLAARMESHASPGLAMVHESAIQK